MKKVVRMSEAEKQIMDIIWANGRPVITSEIISKLPEDKAWKQSTVLTFLARLMEKDMITATRIGKANHYAPSITEQEYLNFETKQFIKDVHRGSVSGLLSALCDSEGLTKKDLEDLMKKLNDQAER